MNRYCPLVRPASMATLPPGLKWNFVEAPWDIAHLRRDIPMSKHRFGVIETERPLTEEERETYSLKLA